MGKLFIAAVGSVIVALGAPVSAQSQEVEYPAGSLAYDTLSKADYARAEKQLAADRRVQRDDPARLLNYGLVMAKTGRPIQAEAMFRRVLSQEDIELVLADGSVDSSHDVARNALGSLGR
jgi:hypothetical protein